MSHLPPDYAQDLAPQDTDPPILEEVVLPHRTWGWTKDTGKVRDIYDMGDGRRALVATDRISAFDINLGVIPFRGQVLNELAAWWFEHTADIVDNHVIAVPDPNVTIVEDIDMIPIEMVVRGYMTGVTDTSIWGSYERGERVIYGLPFRDGYKKNDKLDTPIVTPTTKAASGHDQRLTEEQILTGNTIAPELWYQMKAAALAIFQRGQEVAHQHGLILVDTKYEFGRSKKTGKLLLADEVHTPDSSRYLLEVSYQAGLEDNYDKEHLRKYYATVLGYKGDGPPPAIPFALQHELSKRYIAVYERLTGNRFVYPQGDIKARVVRNMAYWRMSTA